MEIYERSRQRNHSHNVSSSSSLAWARRSLGDGGMASTHGIPNQESTIGIGLRSQTSNRKEVMKLVSLRTKQAHRPRELDKPSCANRESPTATPVASSQYH